MSRIYSTEIGKNINKKVELWGWIHKIRKLGGINFIIIRDSKGLAQAIIDTPGENKKLEGLTSESVVKIKGLVRAEKRAPHGAELGVLEVEIISPVKNDLPVDINKKEINANIETILDNRVTTLRAPRERAIFRVQAEILRAFREFFLSNSFIEINTPKIVSAGAETGGAEMFSLKYFKKQAFLAQSPQLYKQIMVGVFERVFETAYVYRAEPHNTSRHLNEYLSLDIEMGFIKGFEDLLALHQEEIEYIVSHLEKTCKEEFEVLGATLPKVPKKIPTLKLSEAQEILEKEYGGKHLGAPDLDSKGEKQICEYAAKKYGSDFVFITHYPASKRPFYTHLDPKNPEETLSFDLLFRGLEVTTGGQRIHEYEDYLPRMKEKKINPKDFSEYLDAFKYGMPPHGGFCHGLERLTAKFLGLENIREASLFPRDMNRITP